MFTVKLLVSRPRTSTVTSALVVPVRLVTPSGSMMSYSSVTEAEKLVVSIVAMEMELMASTTLESPEIIMLSGFTVMRVLSSVAPAP